MIQSVSTSLRVDESRVFNVLAAQHSMTKGKLLRAALRYVLTHKGDFEKWLKKTYGVTDYDWRP